MVEDKTFHLLIVDDDEEIRDLLGKLLKRYGYDVSLACNGEQMFATLQQQTIDLIILDVMMPGEDGFALCRQLRADSNVPIIMLTAVGEETDRIVGLEMGADDYLTKPFNPRELVARVKAVLRRFDAGGQALEHTTEELDHTVKHFEGWALNTATRRLISPEAVEISLSSGEYDLLEAFITHSRKVLSRDQLLELTRNRMAGPFDRSIDVQVSRLRQKIEENPKQPLLIKTVRGGGYMFTAKVS